MLPLDCSLQDHVVGDVEIFMNEEGALKVVQHYNLRHLLRRLQPKGLERHRVVGRPNCCCRRVHVDSESSFNRFLTAFFFLVLGMAVVRMIVELLSTPSASSYNPMALGFPPFQSLFQAERIIMFLAVLTGVAVAVAVVFAEKKMKNMGSTPQREVEVKTICGLIQQL